MLCMACGGLVAVWWQSLAGAGGRRNQYLAWLAVCHCILHCTVEPLTAKTGSQAFLHGETFWPRDACMPLQCKTIILPLCLPSVPQAAGLWQQRPGWWYWSIIRISDSEWGHCLVPPDLQIAVITGQKVTFHPDKLTLGLRYSLLTSGLSPGKESYYTSPFRVLFCPSPVKAGYESVVS